MAEHAPPGGDRLNRRLLTVDFEPEHAEALGRIHRLIKRRNRFQLIIAQFNDHPYRRRLMAAFDTLAERPATIELTEVEDFSELERRLEERCREHDLVHVVGLERWLAGEAGRARLDGFNLHREAIAEECPHPLVLWMTEPDVDAFAVGAPDMWAWREAVLDFSRPSSFPEFVNAPPVRESPIENLTLEQRVARIQEIRRYLESQAERVTPGARLILTTEWGALLKSLGRFQEAEERYRDAMAVAEASGDLRNRAQVALMIARLRETQGKWDEAEGIITHEVIPVFRKAGEERWVALSRGVLADILVARRQLDEAARMFRDEVIPALELHGDRRDAVVAWGRIADIEQLRGNLDDALRIRQERELPFFRERGEVREMAVLNAKISDSFEALRKFDEALALLREALPAAEQLGDVRLMALLWGRIADILQQQGKLDEALRIREREELPTLERLGSPLERLIAKFKLGSGLLQRAGEADQLQGRRYLCAALEAARALEIPEAAIIAEAARRNGVRCDSEAVSEP